MSTRLQTLRKHSYMLIFFSSAPCFKVVVIPFRNKASNYAVVIVQHILHISGAAKAPFGLCLSVTVI